MNNGTLALSISLTGKERKRLQYTSYKYMLIFNCECVCFSKLYEPEEYMYFFSNYKMDEVDDSYSQIVYWKVWFSSIEEEILAYQKIVPTQNLTPPYPHPQ